MSDIFEGNENDFVTGTALDSLLSKDRARADTPEMVAFRAFFDSIDSPHFSADEFMVLGPSHHSNGPCRGKNSLPDKALWSNVKPLVIVMNAIRDTLGASVRITNCYRNEAYNSCVGGVSGSLHKSFQAADWVCSTGTSADWARAAQQVRASATTGFKGGIGIYNGFVHVDVRGSNADWDNR